MANFNTHVVGAALVSGMVCSTAVNLGFIDMTQATQLWLIGVFGGVLPDIDSDHSHAVSLLFSGLALMACFVTATLFIGKPLWQLWLALIGVFLWVRLPLAWFFKEQTVHRGAYHSLLAALCFGVYGSALGVHVFEATPAMAWAAGTMLALGYICHLILDELYSVDITGMTLKRSFGSAIKPIDLNSWPANIGFASTALIAGWQTPKPKLDYWHIISSIEWQAVLLG